MESYIQSVLAGKMDLGEPVPENVQNLLKTALPADFHNSPDLEWRYVVLNGSVWQIDSAPADYIAGSAEEQKVLAMLYPEQNPLDDQPAPADADQNIEQASV